MAAMALARLVIPAMDGIDTSELLALGDETREELDLMFYDSEEDRDEGFDEDEGEIQKSGRRGLIQLVSQLLINHKFPFLFFGLWKKNYFFMGSQL